MISLSRVHPEFWPAVRLDSQLAADAEELALKIVGEGSFANVLALAGDAEAPAHILARARDIAEAQIDQRRIREVQDELTRGLPGGQTFMDLADAARMIRKKSPQRSMILAIRRYERRAYSRERKATRAFNALLRHQQREVLRLTRWLQRSIDKRAEKAIAA
jgi:hypothetical protein